MKLAEQFQFARKRGVPLIAIDTADARQTINSLKEICNGDSPLLQWDCLQGILSYNELGKDAIAQTGDPEQTIGSAEAFLAYIARLPERSIVFMLNAPLFWQTPSGPNPGVIQGIWNLRDLFKSDRRCLVLLGNGFILPSELSNDIVILDEELPSEERLAEIIDEIDKSASEKVPERPLLTEESRRKVVSAVIGLTEFAAEQAVSMAVRREGVDIDAAWQQKRKMVEATKGLTIYRGGEKFSDIGGLTQIKDYLTKIVKGRKPPKAIIWLDEVEKTGLASRGDTSGVNQDQEGQLLTWMEDYDVYGVMLLGVPGCGKSAICKAVGSQFDLPVLRIDLGAMQGSLVGQSQQNLRTALKIVEAIGGNDTLWLATSNSIDALSAAMRSRYTDTFFFDLPNQAERNAIWKVWIEKYKEVKWNLDGIVDEGWVGRNIRRCVEKAYRMDCDLFEAARYIVPVATIEREEIERLRRQAHGRYLDATKSGVYRMPSEEGKTDANKRRIEV